MIPIEDEEKQLFSRDIKVNEDDTQRDGRLTITNRRFLIDKKNSIQFIGSQKWIPVLNVSINDPIELSLDEKEKCVLVKNAEEVIKICAKDISIDKLLKEIQRNINIARNLSKNNSFSSKKIIYDLKKERGIK